MVTQLLVEQRVEMCQHSMPCHHNLLDVLQFLYGMWYIIYMSFKLDLALLLAACAILRSVVLGHNACLECLDDQEEGVPANQIFSLLIFFLDLH